jgi:hypothetical protein
VPNPTETFADAFGAATLQSFALNPSGAHLFRAQHEKILSMASVVTRSIEQGVASNGRLALEAHRGLTTLTAMLGVHQSFEEALCQQLLGSDPRTRAQAEQAERDLAPVVAELQSLTRRFAAPSLLLAAPDEFAHAWAALLARLQERFRAEERKFFTAVDGRCGANTPAVSFMTTPEPSAPVLANAPAP